MDANGDFDFSNIHVKSSNIEGLDLEPIFTECLKIWLYEYWGTTNKEMDELHYKILRCVVDLFIFKDKHFENSKKFRINVDIENLPVAKLVYDLECAYEDEENKQGSRFYSRFGWQLTDCCLNECHDYQETIRSISIMDFHKPFPDLVYKKENEWKWNDRILDDEKDMEVLGKLDFVVNVEGEIDENEVVQFLRDLRFV